MILVEIVLWVFLFGVGGGIGWFLGEFIILSIVEWFRNRRA